MPVLAWRPKNERGPDLQIADKGSLHAGETIVCAFALLPSVTTERKTNPKAESPNRYMTCATPVTSHLPRGAFSLLLLAFLKREVQVSFAEFYRPDAMSSLTAPLFHYLVRSSARYCGPCSLPVRSNLCHLLTLAHPRSAFSLTRKARPQIV